MMNTMTDEVDSNRNDILRVTLAGLENGLKVEHIMTSDLVTRPHDVSVEVILADPELEGIDQIPVKRGDVIVAVIERPDDPALPGGDIQPRALEESILIAADEPISRFLKIAEKSPYRLVVNGGGIGGIVTRSDLLKLPVRIFLFTLITHLETVMANLIARELPDDDDWLDLLSESRRENVLRKAGSARAVRLDPALLEFADFCDKRTVVRKHRQPGKGFEADLKKVEELRNTLAHAGDYAANDHQLKELIHLVNRAEHWIDELSKPGKT